MGKLLIDGHVETAFAVFAHFMKRDLSPIHLYDHKLERNHQNGTTIQEFQSYAYCSGGRISKTGCIGYGLRDLYLPSLPGLIISLLQFEKLIKLYLPSLYQHFVSQGISVQNYASEWFLSLFCYILPISISLRIIDIFMIDGWKILHRAGLTILFRAKDMILGNNLCFDKILLLLKRKDLCQLLFNNDPQSFIKIAMSFKVTNSRLHESTVHLLTKTMIQ